MAASALPPMTSGPAPQDSRAAAASGRVWIVIFACGVIAAMHVWKFPGAMQWIREDLGMSLVEAGTLLGIVQLASMLLGLSASVFSERLGLRSTLLIGLLLLALGSLAGAFATQTWQLMATRAIEGVGFLFVAVVGPPLIRRWVPAHRTSVAMGWWSAFQGTAVLLAVTASILLLSPPPVMTWHGWWIVMAALSFAALVPAWLMVPRDHATAVRLASAVRAIAKTVAALMPWMLAVMFATYTLQWGAIIGFLPDIVTGSGIGPLAAGLATAVVGGLNGVGNVVAGAVLQRGASPRTMVAFGMVSMLVLTVLLFAPDWAAVPGGRWYQLTAAALFSTLAATIPATLTRVAVDIAPAGGAPSAVIGLMTQVFNAANLIGPVVLTALAVAAGGWHLSWLVTAGASVIGLVLAIVFLTGKRIGHAHG